MEFLIWQAPFRYSDEDVKGATEMLSGKDNLEQNN